MHREDTAGPGASACRYPLDSLVDVMARLRREDGCPWDLQQDHQTLKPYVIEEAYELLDAIDEATQTGDDRALVEELGDILLQVVFHAQIASETGRFTVQDVVDGIREKLVRRHPHIFDDAVAMDKESVERRWEEIKKAEKAAREAPGTTGVDAGDNRPPSIFDGLPKALPALVHAVEVQKRAAKVGFEWEHVDGALEKVAEEAREIVTEEELGDEAPSASQRDRLHHEWGDLLFSLVNVARYSGIDPESALTGASRRFRRRVAYIERKAAQSGQRLEEMSLAQMDALWDEAKEEGE